MKPYEGFKSEANSVKVAPLPAGPYVAKILNVKIDGREPDQTLILRVDVSEGLQAGYFMNRYKKESSNTKSQYPAKYKGDYKLRIPNRENKRAQYPESDIARFNDAIYRIEQSNPGYHWDWNEQGLIGLEIGINMQPGEYNGHAFTRIGRLEISGDVRQGIVSPMTAREQQGDADDSAHIDPQSGFTAVETDELPF